MDLFERYVALKTKVGGNVEKHSFVHTMFPDDFDYAGSLCHGWSAVPIYIFSHYHLQ